jgi:hypothetical protein
MQDKAARVRESLEKQGTENRKQHRFEKEREACG